MSGLEKADKELDLKFVTRSDKLDVRIDTLKEEIGVSIKKLDTQNVINKTKIESLDNAVSLAKVLVDEAKSRVNTNAEKLQGLVVSMENTKKNLTEEIQIKYKETQAKIDLN